MAEVHGMSLDRSLALEAATIVDGHIDVGGNLILTRHDGTEVDAGYALPAIPDASTTVHGIVELATQAETDVHTDGTRAVTPLGLTGVYSRIGVLEAVPGSNVLIISITAESDTPTSYPTGISMMTVTATDAWSLNGSLGTIVTNNVNANRCVQTFYSTAGGTQYTKTWVRSYHTSNGGGGWSVWGRLSNPNDPTSIGMTGEMKVWPLATAPSGWLLCDGSAVSRATYLALFALIGTTFGAGNGTTTFNVPNTKGKTIVGLDSSQTEFDAIGETGGEKTHILTTAEMPAHTHTQNSHSHNIGAGGNGALTNGAAGTVFGVANGTFYGFRATQPDNTTAVNQNTGGGGAHNNLQPYFVASYIIKT